MSLDAGERRRTADDLRQHLGASGLSEDELAGWLGLSPDAVARVLTMSADADPVDVWWVRDALDRAVRERGESPRWGVLTDAARRRGQAWFALRELPPRP